MIKHYTRSLLIKSHVANDFRYRAPICKGSIQRCWFHPWIRWRSMAGSLNKTVHWTVDLCKRTSKPRGRCCQNPCMIDPFGIWPGTDFSTPPIDYDLSERLWKSRFPRLGCFGRCSITVVISRLLLRTYLACTYLYFTLCSNMALDH